MECPELEGRLTELLLAELATWLTADDVALAAPEAVPAAACAAELAAETTECVAVLAVDTADCAVEETALVTPEVETGGEGTEAEGSPEAELVLTEGDDRDGSPEARLADAPDPTMAAGASVRTQIRISDFERFIDVILCAVNARWRPELLPPCQRTKTLPLPPADAPGLGLGCCRA